MSNPPSAGRLIEVADSRVLTQPELLELVARLASDRDRWQHLVRHVPNNRTYEELVLSEPEYAGNVGVWLICWMEDHDTGFHDHHVSSGAVAVAAGRLADERLVVGGPARSRAYAAGESFGFSSADIHRMAHAGGGPAVSIHAYSPPLQQMGAYTIDEGGILRRSVIPYQEELRPLRAAA